MNKFILLSLALCVTIANQPTPTSSLKYYISRFLKKGYYEQLNHYLEATINSTGVRENLLAVEGLLQSGKLKKDEPRLSELARLLALLDLDDPCKMDSLVSLRNSIEMIETEESYLRTAKQPKIGGRIGQVLRNYSHWASSACLPKFESAWQEETEAEFEAEFEPTLGQLGFFNHQWPVHRYSGHVSRLRELDGAIQRIRGAGAGIRKQLDAATAYDFYVTLRTINGQLNNQSAFKLNPETGRPRPVTAAEAAEIIERLLAGPCARFLVRLETQALVRPVAELSRVVDLDSHLGPHTSKWAAVYLTCEWLRLADRRLLAERIVWAG